VLASLLHDSHFNYAMAESADDPNALARVIVFPMTKGSNRQETKDSGAQNQVAQGRVSQPQVSSTPTSPIADKSGSQAGDVNAGDADAAGVADPNVAHLLQQVEAQIMGAVDAIDTNSPQTGQQAGAVAPDNPDGRPRHRRKH
jgi:hypothetical protein